MNKEKIWGKESMAWDIARTKVLQFLAQIRANNLYTVENDLRVSFLPAEPWAFTFMQARPSVRIYYIGETYLLKRPALLLSPRR